MQTNPIARIVYSDGREEAVSLLCQKGLYTLSREPDYSKVKHIDFFPHAFDTPVGGEGYYIVPKDIVHNSAFTGMITFRPRKEQEVTSPDIHSLPVAGAFLPAGATAVALRGGQFLARFVYGLKDGVYYCFPRFTLEGEEPYEPLSVLVQDLPKDADYSDLAKFYRELRIKDGCVPLKEKIKTRPEVKYAAESPYLRIRMGWKPVPTPVLEQTPETEPEMIVAATFRQVGELMNELKAAGVEKAELCLVGWNLKGHDGRWPRMFPVEEKLGGEDDLRRLIANAKEKGYQMVAHTNSTDTYRISDDWNEEEVIRHRDGSIARNPHAWSSGTMYDLCYEKMMGYAQRDFPRAAELGFRGIHYIDVLSIVPPRPCYHPDHPLNVGQAAARARELARYTTEQFGGFSSEGGYDYLCAELDYALNPVRGQRKLEEDDIFDRYVPLWHMVYHGILLYNVAGETLSYPIRDEKRHLTLLEHGARPSLYFNQIFVGNWQTADDFRIGTPEEMARAVKLTAQVWEEYRALSPLQYEFMEKHEVLPENKVRVTYSDGSILTVDYENKSWSLEKGAAFAQE